MKMLMKWRWHENCSIKGVFASGMSLGANDQCKRKENKEMKTITFHPGPVTAAVAVPQLLGAFLVGVAAKSIWDAIFGD